MIKIIGIRVFDRIKEAGFTQDVLSRFSGIITTRLGFHELNEGTCSREGYILLHLKGDPAEWRQLSEALKELGGIEVLEMDFDSNSLAHQEKKGSSEGIRILGILIRNGSQNAKELQRILSLYGCSIRTRMGVNELHFGEPAGLIILELAGIVEEMDQLESDLRGLGGCVVRKIAFGR